MTRSRTRRPGEAGAFVVPRRHMVERMARAGVKDARVLAALAQVPRHLRVPEALWGEAYRDAALPIGEGQTLSAPGAQVPAPLLAQLASGGCLVGPFGPRQPQKLLRVRCVAKGDYVEEEIGRARFVNLVGAHAWS